MPSTFPGPGLEPLAGAVLVFQLAVSDGQGGTATDTVSVSIANVNSPPTASAGADLTVDEGLLVGLDASGSFDADGDTITIRWSQVAGFGPTVVLSDADTLIRPSPPPKSPLCRARWT